MPDSDKAAVCQIIATELCADYFWTMYLNPSVRSQIIATNTNTDSGSSGNETRRYQRVHLDMRQATDTIHMSPSNNNNIESPIGSSGSGSKSKASPVLPVAQCTAYNRERDEPADSSYALSANSDSHGTTDHGSKPEHTYFRFNLPPSRLGTVSLPTASVIGI